MLEVLCRFLIGQFVDLFVAQTTQVDGTAFDTIVRQIFFVFLILMPCPWHQIMPGNPTSFTVA
jgi:hypothetical protein